MKQVRAWGFDYLKLDFLYAGALKGKRFQDIPRETACRESVRVMREAMGRDAYFLTCGTPILPALGLCNAMRIGPDVAGEWENNRDANLFSNPTTPGTKNAIRTVVHRLWLRELVQVDPDVAYFAEKENSLTSEEKKLLQDLALVCGFKATSDLPQWLSEQDREELLAFLKASPDVSQLDRYVFDLDSRKVEFTPTVSLPPAPKGWTAAQASVIGWLASNPIILRLYKGMEDRRLRKRRASL
jgi:alpha-galactosidase